MSRAIFLTFFSIIATGIGLLASFFPVAFLESKGVVDNAAASVWMREVGATLISMGLIAFLVRRHPDSPTMKALLLGYAALQIGLLPIEIIAFGAGTISKLAGIVPNSLLHVLLATAFLFYASRIRAPQSDIHEARRV